MAPELNENYLKTTLDTIRRFHRLTLSERSARTEIHCEAKTRDHSGPRVPGLNLCDGYPAGDW